MMSDYELYLGDCLEYMRSMPDKSVDAVITDVPYGIGENNQKNLSRRKLAQCKDYGNYDWDKSKIDSIYLIEMQRVSKQQAIFGGHYYSDVLPASSGWIVWNKLNGNNDFADCELAWTSYDRAVRKIDWLWNGMIRRDQEERFHPTQKPLGVMRWIVENYSMVNDTIFDPFMGSGTTGVACMQLGRKFIGCEIDPGYYAIAEKRIKQAAAQILLPMEFVNEICESDSTA